MIVSATAAVPAFAQEPAAEIESLITASLDVGSGDDLARRQIAETDLLGAAATLERVLLLHPASRTSRALYAATLCRLDDPEGAQVEIGLLAPQPLAQAEESELAAACGPLRARGQGGAR
jgi:hypothetical protein